jgi:hypothetical protein
MTADKPNYSHNECRRVQLTVNEGIPFLERLGRANQEYEYRVDSIRELRTSLLTSCSDLSDDWTN